MRKCLLCKRELKFYQKVQEFSIDECFDCQLATTVLSSANKLQISTDSSYNLKDYLTIKDLQRNKFKKIISWLSQVIKKGKLLEVGAGFGLFASLISKNRQYQVEVVEPELNLFFLRNTKIKKHQASFESFLKKNKNRKFDAVIILDVLEHLNNPLKTLIDTKKILNENGHLFIQCPNYKSLMAKICRNWSWWMVEDHKYHFSPKSLKKLLEKSGYKTISVKTYEIFYDFRKNLDGNFIGVKSPLLRKPAKGIFLMIFIPVYLLIRKIIWRLGYGGLIFVTAEKVKKL